MGERSGSALVDRLASGDVRALARGISQVEEGVPQAVALLQSVFPRTGNATVIGLTGSPGSGKSSLADRLIATYRDEGRRVGVVAVDPSSAFSGGAILGDRVRMQNHATDSDVFIRSMATRGFLGGLARATNDSIDLMDAAGYDPILVETVGVGQDEVDVVKTADAVVVVLVPGMGDDIQAIKAGILEIADLFVINKADRPGADRLEAELQYMLALTESSERPRPKILSTVATENRGVVELRDAVRAHLAHPDAGRREARRRERARSRLLTILSDRLMERALHGPLAGEALEELVEGIASRSTDPYSAVERVLDQLFDRRSTAPSEET
jgi:LAO/AO transport system kinase